MANVVIAMSGGVDSSAAAALLKEQGHAVTGVMLRLWSEPGKEDANRCCAPDSMTLARRVAASLDIPFYVVDARQIFFDTVVKKFLEGYGAGLTPNPCLLCNRLVRWEFLLAQALDMGAEYVATGHYARLKEDGGGKLQLLRAADRAKDQSYVLHMLTQEKLRRSLFPVGELPKAETRKLAKKYNLPTADRPDSQDLCFVAGEDYREFIRRNAPQTVRPGNIVNASGEVLGEHSGLTDYTIGQRKGLGISSPIPLYVTAKDAVNNTLVVGLEEELGSIACKVEEVNWIAGEAPAVAFRAKVKTRYTAKEAWAEVAPQAGGAAAGLVFEEKVRDLTPGQAAVFYDEAVVLGGGTISSVARSQHEV